MSDETSDKNQLPDEESVYFVNNDLENKKLEARKLAEKLKNEKGNLTIYVTTLSGELKAVGDLTKEEQTTEFLRCALDPIYFIETYLTIFDQTKNLIVPFKLFEFQKELIDAYRNHRLNVANKYRQAGVSTTTCAYITWYVMFTENAKVAVVANKMDTARDELMSDIIDFIDQCPEFLKPEVDRKDAAGHKKFVKGREIKAFAPTTLRGLTPTLIFWDETAWAENGEDFWESARPTLQTGGAAIFVSTPNGLDSVFYKTVAGAPKNQFNSMELYWYNDPRYIVNKQGIVDLEWVKKVKGNGEEKEIRWKDENFSKEKRASLKADGYVPTSSWFEQTKQTYNGNERQLAQELLCSFLGSGDNFVGEEHIKYAEEHTVCGARQEWEDHNMWVWEDPIDTAVYVIAIDVSSGNGDDFSCITILKVSEAETTVTVTNDKGIIKQKKVKRRKVEQVAEYYGKQTPEIIGHIGYTYGRKYNNAYCVVDITGGYGAGTVAKMKELGYENFYYSEFANKPLKDRLSNYKKISSKEKSGDFVDVETYPGIIIGQNRGSILLAMESAVRQRDFIIKSIRMTTELKTFVTMPGNKVADHRRSFHDDSIMANSIGLFVIAYDLDLIAESINRTKSLLNAYTKVDTAGRVNRVEQKGQDPLPASYFNIRGSNPYLTHAWLFADKQTEIQHLMRSRGIGREEAERLYYEKKR